MEILFISTAASLGIFIFWLRLSWKAKLRVLGASLIVDILVFILMFWMHAGSFAGVAVATLGSLCCSGLLSALKFLFGSISSGVYHPGLIDVSAKIK